MAPEQLEGREMDARTDIFAFGAVVYEMVTGKKAFDGKIRQASSPRFSKTIHRLLSTVQPLASPLVDHIVRRCLGEGSGRTVASRE